MNLDDLKAEWAARDRQLQQHVQLNTTLLRESLLYQHERELAKLGWQDKFEILGAMPLFIFLVWFIGRHLDQPKFLVLAYLFLAWTIVMPILSWRNRIALRETDFSLPIISLQLRVESLKLARLQQLKWALLIGQILWFIPFMAVLLKSVAGFDLFTKWNDFMLPSLIGGVVFIPIAIGLSTLVPAQFFSSAKFQQFTDTLAGRDIAKTRAFLDRLARFEKEDL